MQTPRLSRERQQRFLAALAGAGDVSAAASTAGVSKARVDEVRKLDAEFSAEWEAAQQVWADKLEQEARRRAVEGVREPLVSDGKIVRDDDGQPIVIRRYSDELLLAFLRTHRPEKFHDFRMVEITVHPRWLRYLLAAFVLAFAVWVVGDLVLHAVHDRALVVAQPR